MEQIGIDTHGLDMPPEDDDLSEADEKRLEELEGIIYDAMEEYLSICRDKPYISGYVTEERHLQKIRDAAAGR